MKGVPGAQVKARRLLWLLLGQRDRQVATEGETLPLVAGGAAQLDVDHEGLGLTGLQDTEVPAGGQGRDRGERDAPAGRADADTQLRVVDVRRRGGVGEVAAEVGRRRDGAVVRDVERLRDELARLQVVEVEVDRAAVVRVADAEDDRGGVDVDARGVGVVERGARGNRDGDRRECDEASSEDGTDGGTGAGLRGHGVPSL